MSYQEKGPALSERDEPVDPDELAQLATDRYNSGDWAAAELLCGRVLAQVPDHGHILELARQLAWSRHTSMAKERFPGIQYLEWLQWFHRRIRPATYLEIGVESGRSLSFAIAPTRAVGIDPALNVVHTQNTWSKLFGLESDDFFARHDLRRVLDHKFIDFAFIDGLHTFDQALRDFINIERYAHPGTVVLFHDIFPVVPITAARDRSSIFWLGDTWKAMLILREMRPDLAIFTIPTWPSGLGVVSRLNSNSTVLRHDLGKICERWMDEPLEKYFDNMEVHLNVVENRFESVAPLLDAERDCVAWEDHREFSPSEEVAAVDAIFVQTAGGLEVSVPASLDSIWTYALLEQEQWFEGELGFLLRWVKRGMNVVDIGANVGAYCLPLQRAVESGGRVFAFEPSRHDRIRLESSCSRNKLDRLEISGCALADAEKKVSTELDALRARRSRAAGDSATGRVEPAQVSTLDVQAREQEWPSIDFIRIDEAVQGARVAAGGRSFFASQSPLVMYSCISEGLQSQSLRWLFEALGYRTYRLLGDSTCLVAVDSDHLPDRYERNYFCAKPDRAESLASAGLLVEGAVEHSLSVAERERALQGMLALPYAQAFEFSVDDIADCPFGQALIAYAAYRYVDLPSARRYSALLYAYDNIMDACQQDQSPAALATLARISMTMGARGVAVDALSALIAMSDVTIDQPFFPPCERFDQLMPSGRESEWFVAASNEQFELAREHSSFFADGDLDRLKKLCEGSFSSPRVVRRLVLQSMKRGTSLQELQPYLSAAHDHLNAQLWTPRGLSDFLALR